MFDLCLLSVVFLLIEVMQLKIIHGLSLKMLLSRGYNSEQWKATSIFNNRFG